MEPLELPERWAEIDALLAAALEIPPSRRSAFVRERTDGDPDLRRAIEELLSAEAQATSFLERPIELDSETWLEVSDEFFARRPRREPLDFIGETIGSWRIERELGRGGMARVFLAERTSGGFEQRAALKLLRSDLAPEVVERFRDERQILSNLAHPHVARLLDGGATADGQPYLVMEAVDGEPITDWCDRRRLGVEKRLELFRDVLSAVQYAHSNLVVHRDIKPSNILVTAAGHVKLLDFGIAALLDPDRGRATREPTPRLLFTPEYASPEQVTGAPITTASDVYQLGLLLYRLLTGAKPYMVPGRPRDAMRDAVVETVPDAPSTSPSVADRSVAEARTSTPRRLARRLRGDLDAIVLRALQKDPDDRYPSVAALDADLSSHLDNRPVGATGGGAAYRVRKYFGRHRWAAPVLVAATVAAAAYVGVQQTHERQLEAERNAARAEAIRAEAVRGFMVELFRSADPWQSADPDRGRNITVREALATGAERARAELADQPEVQVELLSAIAGVYRNLSLNDEALPLFVEALDVERRTGGDDVATRVGLLLEAGRTLNALDRHDSAEVALRTASDLARELEAPHDTAAGMVVAALADNETQRGRYERAVSMYRRSDSLLRASSGATSAQRALVQLGLANALPPLNRLVEAREAAGLHVELATEAFGAENPRTAAALVELADVLDWSGHDEASVAVHRQAVATLERALGEEHEATLSSLNNLGLTLEDVGRPDEAIAVLRRVLELQTRQTGIWHREAADAMQNLAMILLHQGEEEEAAELLTRAHRVYESVLPDGHYLVAYPLLTRSSMELDRGAFPAAERTTRRALRVLDAALPEGHVATAMAECRLGRALLGQERYGAAEPLLRSGAEVAPEAPQIPPEYGAECLDGLARVLEATGRTAEAQPYRTAMAELTGTRAERSD